MPTTTGWRASRREAIRLRRLDEKLQKAGALDRRAEVLAEGTWNRRFGAVARLRSTPK